MPDSVVIAGSTFLPLISYRFRTELDRNFDRWRLLVLVCLDSTILFSAHCMRWIWFIFSPGGHTDGLSLTAYSDGGVAARF